jgi:hypothetical protein
MRIAIVLVTLNVLSIVHCDVPGTTITPQTSFLRMTSFYANLVQIVAKLSLVDQGSISKNVKFLV